jgi:hypothetical protein
MQRTIALSTALLSVTLMFLIAIHGTIPASAGEATPNVTGKWEGTYDGRGRFGSGEITFHLRQEGNKVTGKQSVVDLIPVWGSQTDASTIVVGEEIRDGEIDGSTLHFHVTTEGVRGQLNFTLTVSGDTMTGTVCGYNCGKLKLKKAPM